MHARLVGRVVALLVVVTALVGGAWRLGYAHATLVSAEPVAGSVVATAPTRVRLVFSEAVEPALAQLSLDGGDGGVTPLATTGDPRDVYAVIAPLGTLTAGGYRVLWRVVSVDGHPVGGSFVFTIRGGSGTTSSAAPPMPHDGDEGAMATDAAAWWPAIAGAPLVPAILRGIGVGSLMALTGLLGMLVLPRGAGTSEPQRARRLATGLAVAAASGLALHLVAWVMNTAPEHRATSEWAGVALGSGAGRVELWRTGLAALALWALALARRPGLALLFGVAALLASAGAGHTAAIQPLAAVPLKAVHLIAAAAWLGGLLWLVVRERADALDFAREAARVSAIALPAAVLVAASGVVETFLFVRPSAAALRSAYGVLVLAKLVGLLVLLAFGAHHRVRAVPRLAREAASLGGHFGVTLRREVAVMTLVVLVGGLLAYTPPAQNAPVAPFPLPSSHLAQ